MSAFMDIPYHDHEAGLILEMDKFFFRFGGKKLRRVDVIGESDLAGICEQLNGDLSARMQQDPAGRNADMVFRTNAFKAILAYRIAHLVLSKANIHGDKNKAFLAHELAEFAASRHAIEINPTARIGKRFVIDHGINTLIGATSKIGDDCTILQNVVLGANRITGNADGKRHPTIGNHVKIGGGVRIFGPVTVGNFVTIGPDCIITEDVPDFTLVKLVKTIQKTVFKKEKNHR